MDIIVYLIIMAVLLGFFITGLVLGDTDDMPQSYTPGQIRAGMRGLKPWPRLWTAIVGLTHAIANGFVEGLVLCFSPRRSQPLGRFMAVMLVGSLMYGFLLIAR